MKSLKNIIFFSWLMGSTLLILPIFAQDQVPTPPPAPAVIDKVALCLSCHEDSKPKAIYKTRHGVKADERTPNCQSCHGESEKHLTNDPVKGRPAPDVIFSSPDAIVKKGNYELSDAKTQNQYCLTCHGKDPKRTAWTGSGHQTGSVSCVSCHKIHSAEDSVRNKKTQTETCFVCHKEQRAESKKMSHHPMIEGKVSCTDCHDVHGSAGPKMLKKNTLNETCFSCHAEKRGPFLWEHAPVSENCANCHVAHGSNLSSLLKSRSPIMCNECHDGPHTSRNPSAGNQAGNQGGLTAVPSDHYTGRGCMNCHNQIHGTNHPAGSLLHR